MVTRFFSHLLLLVIKGYQTFISPVIPARCRYYPTCSEYAKTAVIWHGPGRGGWLATKRICSCHPFGGQGIDFVPLPLYKRYFTPYKQPFVSCETTLMDRGVFKDNTSYRVILNNKISK